MEALDGKKNNDGLRQLWTVWSVLRRLLQEEVSHQTVLSVRHCNILVLKLSFSKKCMKQSMPCGVPFHLGLSFFFAGLRSLATGVDCLQQSV